MYRRLSSLRRCRVRKMARRLDSMVHHRTLPHRECCALTNRVIAHLLVRKDNRVADTATRLGFVRHLSTLANTLLGRCLINWAADWTVHGTSPTYLIEGLCTLTGLRCCSTATVRRLDSCT